MCTQTITAAGGHLQLRRCSRCRRPCQSLLWLPPPPSPPSHCRPVALRRRRPPRWRVADLSPSHHPRCDRRSRGRRLVARCRRSSVDRCRWRDSGRRRRQRR